MACLVTPFNLIKGSPQQGGTWTLQSGGPMLVSVNGASAASITNGGTVSTLWDATLSFDSTASGSYVLEYTVTESSCSVSTTVTLDIRPSAKSGVDRTIFKCIDDNYDFSLFDFIRGGDGTGSGTGTVDSIGTWSGPGTGPAFLFSPYNAYSSNISNPHLSTFNPSKVNLGGNDFRTTSFVYTVRKSPSSSCSNCLDTSTVTLTTVSECEYCNNCSTMLLRHDFGSTIDNSDLTNGQVISFVVDGDEKLTSPVSFDLTQNINMSGGSCVGCTGGSIGTQYNAAIVNVLSSLAIPQFTFSQPSNNELRGIGLPSGYVTCHDKYVKVKAPICVDWEITIQAALFVDNILQMTWANTGGTISVTADAGYLLGTNTVPNPSIGSPCNSGVGNNYIPLGTEDLC